MQKTTVTRAIKAALLDLPSQSRTVDYPESPLKLDTAIIAEEVTQAIKAAYSELPIKIAWEDWLREATRATKAGYPELSLQPRTLLTVRQFSDKHPAFPQGSLRNFIFLAESRNTSKGKIKGNGLDIALVRIGRKLLIDEVRFFQWIEEQQGGAK